MTDKLDNTDEKTRLTENEKEEEKMADGVIPDGHTDDPKVKFIGNGGANADVAAVTIEPKEAEKPDQDEFQGLSKSELMKYADDPFWKKVRWALLILFWLAWFGMLAAAIIIIILAPKCPPRPKLDWWQKSVLYKTHPRSFKDGAPAGKAKGIGNLKGIHDKLSYFKDLNANVLMLGPLTKSPNADVGYDVSDYKEINPEYGTMKDFDDLRVAMHKKGMKMVMDFVPNHSSMNHSWFMESRKSKTNKFSDYYVWANPLNGGPPNGWVNADGESAWTFVPERQQYYLHQFKKEQPDLNYRNKEVREAMEGVLRFWLDKGVDGFRVDSAAHLVEVVNVTGKEEPMTGPDRKDYNSYSHIYTTFQPETYKIITDWRAIMDDVAQKTEKPRFLFVDVPARASVNNTNTFYEYEGKQGAHLVANKALNSLTAGTKVADLVTLVRGYLSGQNDRWTTWMLGDDHVSRVATRVTEKSVNAANFLVMTLGGTGITYYGEEIGMVDGASDVDSAGKTNMRYKQLTPMQWTNDKNAGFTMAATPWLAVNLDYKSRNVQAQTAVGGGHTNLESYQSVTALRKEPSFQWGVVTIIDAAPGIFSFVRQATGFPGYLVAINMGTEPENARFHTANPQLVPAKGTVKASTHNFNHQDFQIGREVTLDNILLHPYEGVIFTWPADAVKQK